MQEPRPGPTYSRGDSGSGFSPTFIGKQNADRKRQLLILTYTFVPYSLLLFLPLVLNILGF